MDTLLQIAFIDVQNERRHVARERLVVIQSPLDQLWKEGGIDWEV
jgi:hypothetical protein